MIITFGTQKGGVGKTTLAIAFANYLSLYCGKKVNVIDFDFQKSFYQKWLDDETISGNYLYDVELIDDSNIHLVQSLEVLQEMKQSDDIFLFDVAGNIQKKYNAVITLSDYIVVPFSYSDVTLNSTITFLNLCHLLKIQGKLFFVRNGIDKSAKYVNQPDTDIELKRFGTLLENSVYKRNCLQTITTKKLLADQKSAVKQVFDELIYNIYGNTG